LKVQVVIGGETYEVEIEDTGNDSSQPVASEGIQSVVLPDPDIGPVAGSEDGVYRSPVAGLVARVNVKWGQEVPLNDVLLVLEAMKMETSILATTAGKLKRVHVAQGEAVKIGQILLEFE
jgi:biotin carboxyl carrier protein